MTNRQPPTHHDSQDLQRLLQQIPAISHWIEHFEQTRWAHDLPRPVLVAAIRNGVDEYRAQLRSASTPTVYSEPKLLAIIESALSTQVAPALGSVINATGILLHTGLGRAPLADSVVEQMADVARRYAPIELNMKSGKRGHRSAIVRSLLCDLTGAESAVVVNNTSAAMLLMLATLAKEQEVIVSRGELVEIGGSFRIPDVIESGGAQLREVGTTNRTRLSDYSNAINEQTGAILKVHTSNYCIQGFAEDVEIASLASLASAHDLPCIHDIGSGLLKPASAYGLAMNDEPNATDSIRDGADLVAFSGDKLLGGPQAGIILGKRELIEQLEQSPMMRALRVDKITLAALGAVLQLHRDPADASLQIPALRMATESLDTVRTRGKALISNLQDGPIPWIIEIRDSIAYMGGGSVPGQTVPSLAVVLSPSDAQSSVEVLAQTLRVQSPAVLGRVRDGMLWLDLRTIFDDQIVMVAKAIRSACLNDEV